MNDQCPNNNDRENDQLSNDQDCLQFSNIEANIFFNPTASFKIESKTVVSKSLVALLINLNQ